MDNNCNFFEAVDNRFNKIYSYGGEVERSFWQNVGKIVNKQSFAEKNDDIFGEITSKTESILRGNKR